MSFEMRRVETPRITLNIREAGAGRPILFYHGITANGAVFDPITSALSKEFKCIAVDQRGHGRSDKPASGYKAVDFASDVAALITTLELERPIIVGHSLGARNGIVSAGLYPDLIAGVIAVDFTPFIEKEVLDALATRVNGGDRAFASRQEIHDYLQARYPLMPSDAVARRVEFGYQEAPDGLRPLASATAMEQTALGLRDDLAPALSAVNIPLMLVRGAISKLVTEDAFAKTRALRPDLEAVEVAGADHYVLEAAPVDMIAIIKEFVAKIDA